MQILIAGASRGIGKYLADQFAMGNDQVFGTYHHTRPDVSIQYQLTQLDITDEEQVRKWILQSTLERQEELALINCAGVNYNALLHKSDTASWMRVIETNLKAAYILTKHILPIMRKKKFGRIIHISSVVPQIGVAGTSAYSASKSALWGLTRSAAIENARFGITVNSINLGYFNIGMIHEVPPDMLDTIIKRIPLGKLGDITNILNAARFLLDSDYITGSQINLNGGLY